jgi:hypothetical protein
MNAAELKELLLERYTRPGVKDYREIAALEKRYWLQSKADYMQATKGLNMVEWICKECEGVTSSDVHGRSSIFNRGDSAADVWKAMQEGNLSLRTAVNMCRTADKQALQKKTSFDAEISRLLGNWRILQADRAKAATVSPKEKRKHQRKVKLDSLVPDSPEEWSPDVDNGKKFMSYVEILARKYVEQSLPEADATLTAGMLETFLGDMHTITRDLLRRVSQRKKNPLPIPEVHAVQLKVMQACRILGVKPIKKNGDIEWDEAKAKFLYFDLARKRHPDHNHGKKAEEQFIAVQKAWETLSDYKEALRKRGVLHADDT